MINEMVKQIVTEHGWEFCSVNEHNAYCKTYVGNKHVFQFVLKGKDPQYILNLLETLYQCFDLGEQVFEWKRSNPRLSEEELDELYAAAEEVHHRIYSLWQALETAFRSYTAAELFSKIENLKPRKEWLYFEVGTADEDGTIHQAPYGQGMIFKSARAFYESDGFCYVPEDGAQAYTTQDFVNLCKGNTYLAEEIFHHVDWQHPSTELDQMKRDNEITTCKYCDSYVNTVNFTIYTEAETCPLARKNRLELTPNGARKVRSFAQSLRLFQRIYRDMGESCDGIHLPDEDEILQALNEKTIACTYSESWPVTVKSSLPIFLKCGRDFVPKVNRNGNGQSSSNSYNVTAKHCTHHAANRYEFHFTQNGEGGVQIGYVKNFKKNN